MNRTLILSICLLGLTTWVTAQQAITLQDIWQRYAFIPRSVPGFNFLEDGKHYTRLEDNQINQYDLTTGQKTSTLFDAETARATNQAFVDDVERYTFSADERKILIQTATEGIYRRSYRANFFVWDTERKKMITLSRIGKQGYATFSPDGNMVAYVIDNDLYYFDLEQQQENRITRDGRYNHIINGSADWVYEEELSFAKAFFWSPDSKNIAFMRFDETRVKEFTMVTHRDEVYPDYVTFKYPKVGEDNAIVTLHLFNVADQKITKIDAGYEADGMAPNDQLYFPRIKWTQDPNQLCVFKMNRLQNKLDLLLADASTGTIRPLLTETNPYYIDITDDLTFLKDGKQFIWTSEKDGYNHIYLHGMDGKLKRQLTQGNFDVTSFYGVDEARGMVYYQAAEGSPLDRQVYRVDLKGKNKQNLTPTEGSHMAQFSGTFDYYVHTYSTINKPATYTVYDREGKQIRVIEDNKKMLETHEEYAWNEMEFFEFETSEKVKLNGWMIKPDDFDAAKQYPVLMYVYGGPGSQTVQNSYGGGFNPWWFQMLAQEGYVVVSIDNRGTGARGQEFKKMTYQQLGKYETIDQIEGAKYLGGLPYIDAERIGIFGWSYGGYMASSCLFKGNGTFKAAIAVAPVTNWKWYDTIYTERYMRTLKENEAGYRDNSPVYFADQMQGELLLVHGQADDNVHFQNTAELVNALVRADKQFDTYFYPNRNHGIFGGNTRYHLYTKMTTFLRDNL